MADEGAASEAGERSLFAAPTYIAPPLPVSGEVALVPPKPALPAKPRPAFARISKTIALRSASLALSTEVDRGGVFLLAPVFLAFGAIVYFVLPLEPSVLAIAAATLAAASILALISSRGIGHFALLAILLCLCGMLAAKVETLRAGTKMLGGEISTQLTGRVLAIDHMANGRVRLTLGVLATERPVLRYAPERVRASAAKIPAGLRVGMVAQGVVRLMPPSGPVRPESYDFSFESYFDGIGASGFFLRGPQIVESQAEMPGAARFSAWVEDGRNRIADRIRERIGGAEGEIAAALVVGVRAGIPEEINEALRRAGLYHVISISGLHMALVAGTVMGGLRAGFALFPAFASRRPVKKYAAALALAALAAYLFISGGEVAAQRSFIMLAVMLVALMFDRAALTMRNLAISAIVVILLSPHEVMGPSFQMSFAATAALVGAYAFWSDRKPARPRSAVKATPSRLAGLVHKTSRIALGLVMTSIIAGLATAAFGAYHFQRISPLSLAANLAAMPFVSLLVMPFAVLGAVTMPFGLDGPFFAVMGKGLTAMIAIARWFSAHSPIDAVGAVSLQSVVLLTVALVLATMSTTWLRAACLPFALAGLLTLSAATPPDALVSEDGIRVAVPLGNGRMAVNRARPNQFTLETWQRLLAADSVVKPVGDSQAENSPVQGKQPDATPTQPLQEHDIDGQAFTCRDGLCAVRHPSGAIVVHAANEDAARKTCAFASLIVIDDATAKLSCPGGKVAIITKRDLARSGSAAVFFPEGIVGRGERSERSSAHIKSRGQQATDAEEAIGAQAGAEAEKALVDGEVEKAREAAKPKDRIKNAKSTEFEEVGRAAEIGQDANPGQAKQKGKAAEAGEATEFGENRKAGSAITAGQAGKVMKTEQAANVGEAMEFRPTIRRRHRPYVEFAIARPYRPWHAQRQFSREARGLPPYQRKPKPPTNAAPATPKQATDPDPVETP